MLHTEKKIAFWPPLVCLENSNKWTSPSLLPAFPDLLLFLSPAYIQYAGISFKGSRPIVIMKMAVMIKIIWQCISFGESMTSGLTVVVKVHVSRKNSKNPSYFKYVTIYFFYCLLADLQVFVIYLYISRSPGLCSCVFYNWQRVLQSNPYMEGKSCDRSWRHSHSSCAE